MKVYLIKNKFEDKYVFSNHREVVFTNAEIFAKQYDSYDQAKLELPDENFEVKEIDNEWI